MAITVQSGVSRKYRVIRGRLAWTKIEKYIPFLAGIAGGLLYIPLSSTQFDLNGIIEASAVESGGASLFSPNHMLYRPIGLIALKVAQALGYSGRSIEVLQLLTAVCAAIGLGFVFRFYRAVSDNALAAAIATSWFAVSWATWAFSTDASYIMLSAMLTAVALTCLSHGRMSYRASGTAGLLCTLSILAWQANIFLVLVLGAAIWYTQGSVSLAHRNRAFIAFLGVTGATTTFSYTSIGVLAYRIRDFSGLLHWISHYGTPLPMWGQFKVERIPVAVVSAIGSLVPVWEGLGLRKLLKGSVSAGDVLVQFALIAAILLLVLPLLCSFHSLHRSSLSGLVLWLIGAYAVYLPFIIWWEPFEPKWFIIPNIFLGALMARGWPHLLRLLPVRVLLFGCVTLIAIANFAATIWPRHAQPSPYMQRAGCVAAHMRENDVLLATDWQWPGYVSYFSQRRVLSLIELSARMENTDVVLAALDAELAETSVMGGKMYVIDPQAYPASYQQWLATQSGFSAQRLDLLKSQEAFSCENTPFRTITQVAQGELEGAR